MARLQLRRFAGKPAGLDHTSGGYAFAHSASDVDFSAGGMRPTRNDRLIGPLPGGASGAGSFMVEGCCLTAGEACEAIVPVRLPCERYFRVRNGVLENSRSPCEGWTRLGHPCIKTAPQLLTSRIQTKGKVILRQYIYTVMNDFDEIEAVSMPSNAVVGDWDRSALITGIERPLVEQNATHRIRVYSTAPDQSLGPNAAPSDINFFAVNSVRYGSDSTQHDPAIHPYAEAFVPEDYTPPPEGLYSLAHWGGRQLAGLADGFLWFSLPNNYAIWPSDAAMRFEDEALAFVAGRSLGYVLTCGRPVVIDLTRDCKDGRCHGASTLPVSLPIISPHSAAMHGEGVIFASRSGLVYLQGERWVLLTGGLSRDEWMAMEPTRSRGVMHQGNYFMLTPAGAWRFRLPGNPIDPAALRPDITRLSVAAESWFRTADDRLLYATGNGYAYEWAADPGFRDAVWDSEPIPPGSRIRWVHVDGSRDVQYSVSAVPYKGKGAPDRLVIAPASYRSGPGWAKLPPSVDRGWWTLRVQLHWGEIEALTMTSSRSLSGAR